MTHTRGEAILAAPFPEQIFLVLEEEARGNWFCTTLDKSILNAVAPPGGSQHHSLLALDVEEYDDARVRDELARQGWYRTVPSDTPHFTYLGLPADKLPAAGLAPFTAGGRTYWIPARN